MEDLIWEWDAAFDANAVIAVMGSWNELMDEDVEAMFVPTPEMRSYGPLSLRAGNDGRVVCQRDYR